jgi:UDP-N-acetylglucosamine acyltransferase
MTEIHPTAIVAPGAELDEEVAVGPYCVIGPHVKLGKKTRLLGHVYLDGWTTIGPECTIFPFASIGTQTQDLKYKGGVTFVEIGEKTTLREYVTVNSGTNEGDVTRVGARCHIMTAAHIAHQCIVGNDVIISNLGTLAGHVIIEDFAIIGGMGGVHQFVRLGRMCFLGACSKATQDIPPFMIADGNPATIRGLNIVGLQRHNVPEETRRMLKEAHRSIYRQNLTVQKALEKIKAELPACPELEHLTAFIASSERGIVR